ncbi:MAG: hypothetical protein QOI83_2734 [Streptomycetaceae bacterium]|nr:hypothetical protein [Streptomycetaceae bacterium]
MKPPGGASGPRRGLIERRITGRPVPVSSRTDSRAISTGSGLRQAVVGHARTVAAGTDPGREQPQLPVDPVAPPGRAAACQQSRPFTHRATVGAARSACYAASLTRPAPSRRAEMGVRASVWTRSINRSDETVCSIL